MSRTLVVVAGAVTALAVAASPALAVQSKQSLTASISPVKHSHMAKASAQRPANVALNIHPKLSFDRKDTPFAITTSVIKLDRSVSFGGYKLPGCSASQVVLNTCAPNTKVGGGTAMALAAGLNEPLTLTAYNGNDGRTLLIHVQGERPVPMNDVLVATLSKSSGAYGSKMTIHVPDSLQQPAPGVLATLLDFNLTVKGGNATSPLIGVAGCPRGGLQVGGAFTYTDGTTQHTATTAACKS
jgi:hypothetical protein